MKLGLRLSAIGTIIMFVGLQIANFAFFEQKQKLKELNMLLDQGLITYANFQEQRLDLLHAQYDEYALCYIPFAIGVFGVVLGFIVSCFGLRHKDRKFSYYGILTSIVAILLYFFEQITLEHILK